MRNPFTKRKCKNCKTFFDPHRCSAGRQRTCSKPKCRQASKAASQRRWLQKPANRDDFKGPTQVERVRQWRQAHPGTWRRQAAGPTDALQDASTPQPVSKQTLGNDLTQDALQDSFFMQPTVLVGLIAHLTGYTSQDNIEMIARKLQQLGHDILSASPPHHGGIQDAQTPHFTHQTPTGAQPVQLGRSAPGP